tara:strand:- start:745 stop:1110 length:366 start_codon:yes stop_codon:yes gene_type:complete
MKYEFKIIVFSNDPSFSMSLASECDKYDFMLAFVDKVENIKEEIGKSTIAVLLVDLNEDHLNPFELCQKIKNSYELPAFGVLNKFSKSVQEKAKKSGYDLIFTKKMLLRSIREVVIHVSNE